MKSFLKRIVLAFFVPKSFLALILIIISSLILFAFENVEILQPIKNTLSSESLSIKLGEGSYSLYDAFYWIFFITIFFSFTGIVIDLVEKGISKLTVFNSNTVNRINLISKIVLFILSVVIGLNILGVDLSSLAFLTSALVVGIGFGLQKIISN